MRLSMLAALLLCACTGDPTTTDPVDTDTDTTVTYDDVQPIFADKCAPCHTSTNSGGLNIGSTYEQVLDDATHASCAGLNKGECTIVRIQAGQMPAGCTGDPAQDAGNADCTTQDEQDLIQAWIDAGLPEN